MTRDGMTRAGRRRPTADHLPDGLRLSSSSTKPVHSEMGGSEPDQVAEQLDPGRVDERHAGEVQAEAARRGVQLLADATQLVDPRAKELALELEGAVGDRVLLRKRGGLSVMLTSFA